MSTTSTDTDSPLTVTIGKKINANALRALAEATDAFRNRDAYLVERPAGSEPAYIVTTEKPPRPEDGKIIIELHTRDDQKYPDRPLVKLSATPPLKDEYGTDFQNLDIDAVFTTLSAVDKFLVPYYARSRTLVEVMTMRQKFIDNSLAVAAFHLPSSYEGRAIADQGVLFAKATKDGSHMRLLSFEEFIASD